MSNKILVTDSLFIFDEHVKKLEAADFEVERLDKPEASEKELVAAEEFAKAALNSRCSFDTELLRDDGIN